MKGTFGGVNLGSTLLQENGTVGGSRNVFVKLRGVKDELIFPPHGAQLKNPFKGAAKIYSGDLFEYRADASGENPSLYLLKTYKAKSAASSKIVIYRDGFKHIPFVGDNLMIAPSVIGGTGKAMAVTAVEVNSDGNWELTFGSAVSALGTITDGTILVEAEAAGDNKAMLVKAVNAVAPCDYDCFYQPSTGDNDWDGARYLLTPALGGLMYINKMSPLPACVLALNKCNINGWFKVDYLNKVVDSANLDNVVTDINALQAAAPIVVESAPTTSTAAAKVGQIAILPTASGEKAWICTAITPAVGSTPASYTWVKFLGN